MAEFDDLIPAKNEFSDLIPAQPGILESFARGASEGATFGFDDKLGVSKQKREESRKTNPWTHFMGEVAGSILPITVSTLLPNPATTPVAATRAGQLLKSGAGLVRSAMAPGEIATVGQSMAQGAKLGATYGGLSGAGHADVRETDSTADALAKRAIEATKGAVLGTGIGAGAGAVTYPLVQAAKSVAGARAAAKAETEDASAGALTAMSRGLERDRMTPDTLIAQIKREFPDDTATASGSRFWGKRQRWEADQVEDVVRRAMNGESASEISAAMRSGGTGPGPKAVQTLLDELADRHLGPLNIVDRAALERTGSGTNTQMTLRAAAATPGEAQSIARESLLERQIGSGGRLQGAFEKVIGSADYDGVAARHEASLQAAENAAYAAARASEKPFDLNPIINKWTGPANGKRGPIPEAVMEAVDSFVEKVPIQNATTGQITGYQLKPPTNLKDFIDARQNMLAVAMKHSPGVPKNRMIALNDDRISPQSRQIMRMRGELSAEVRKTNPDWGFANDLTRDGRGASDAMVSGAKQALRLNSQSRSNLVDFTAGRELERAGLRALKAAKTPPETRKAQAQVEAGQAQQNLFRVGLVRKLSDELSNKQSTHDLTAMLRLPAARKLLTEILGKEDAEKLLKVVRAEHAMNRTYVSQFGSQTTPLKEAVDELNWAPRFEASWHNLGFGKALQLAADYAARNINNKRNEQLMRLYTNTDPIRQLETLRAAQQVHAARSRGANIVGQPLVGLSAPLTEEAVARQSQPVPAMTPYRP
jgi:hypothetical protein